MVVDKQREHVAETTPSYIMIAQALVNGDVPLLPSQCTIEIIPTGLQDSFSVLTCQHLIFYRTPECRRPKPTLFIIGAWILAPNSELWYICQTRTLYLISTELHLLM
ncbi:hypothetical protein HGRIS_002145 [Hohenbuehelia grisea]|uniref:Uncharacterized protein n=1 Tax=Hohenbuehelia grisea TaxID=104357 RepID=A0ABR3JKQ3_9AGAR